MERRQEEAAAVVIETSSQRGLGTTVLAVVRAGVLRPAQWFVCGATLGKIRQLHVPRDSSPMRVGATATAAAGGGGGGVGGGGGGGSLQQLEEAGEGTPVSLVVAWARNQPADATFAVGDELRVLPEARAKELAEYRQAVALFHALRREPPPMSERDYKLQKGRVPGTKGAAAARLAAEEEAAADGGVEVAKQAAADLANAGVAPRAPEAAAAMAADVAAELEALEAGGAPQPRVGAVIKAAHAGELQAVRDFLKPRVPPHRVQLLHFGVGAPSRLDVTICTSAIAEGLPSAVYAFNLRVPHAVRAEAKQANVPLREYQLLHELLTDLLERAGLPGPALELARMSADAPDSS